MGAENAHIAKWNWQFHRDSSERPWQSWRAEDEFWRQCLPLADVRVGSQRRLSSEELMLSDCGAGKDSWEFLGLQRDQTSQSYRKLVLNIHWKDWCWSWSSNTLATWCEELTHWKRPWCWERWKAGGDGTTDEMVGWHHQLNRHEFEQAPGVGDGQGTLAWCSPWGHKE